MPVLFIFTPLLGILILNLIKKEAGRKAAFGFMVVISIAQIIGSIVVLTGWSGLNLNELFTFGLFQGLSVGFFSAVVLLTIGLIALVSSMVGKRMVQSDRLNFTNILLVALIGMNGAVMTSDLFTLYIFLEITAVTAFIMIALFRDRDGLGGAFKYLVMSSIATIMLLSGIALLYLKTGDLTFGGIKTYLDATGGVYPMEIIAGIVLFISGLSIKAGLVPFNGWVPDAYTSSPPAVSVLLAGIITKVAGVYAIMRLVSDTFSGILWIRTVLMVLALLSIFVGALAAIRQNDFKRMLSFSSISQVGYIILGVSVGTPLGFAGAILHFFNHAIFKSLLFVNSAAVEERTGTRDIRELGGLASVMPITGGTSVVAFLSASGIPPLAGFWSKLLIIMALWMAGFQWAAILALLASVLTLAYFLILQRKTFFGKPSIAHSTLTEADPHLTVPSLLLAAITVVTGVLMPFVIVYMNSRGFL